jgi:hypothetical protein
LLDFTVGVESGMQPEPVAQGVYLVPLQVSNSYI